MEDCKHVNSPLNHKEKLSKDDGADVVNETHYRSLTSCLMYLTTTRPYILYVVSVLSTFMHCPCEEHLKAAKRVVRYIKRTINYEIKFQKSQNLLLVGYSNNDWGGSLDDRKSALGYCFSLGLGIFSWCSKKQETIA